MTLLMNFFTHLRRLVAGLRKKSAKCIFLLRRRNRGGDTGGTCTPQDFAINKEVLFLVFAYVPLFSTKKVPFEASCPPKFEMLPTSLYFRT